MEDIADYNDAIDYISRLGFREAEKTLIAYGKILVNNVPEITTNLLKQLCTDYIPKDTTTTLLESNDQRTQVDQSEEEPLPIKKKLKSAPESFIHIFVNQPQWLTNFIEFMIKVEPDSSPILYDTLLELYLKEAVFPFPYPLSLLLLFPFP